jgi:hypothetical protein
VKSIKYDVTHYYQPTTKSCGYTALAILLSHYGIIKDPLDLANTIAEGRHMEFGSLTAEVAAWCRTQDLVVEFISFDFFITDFAWRGLGPRAILERLKAVIDHRDVPSLGKEVSHRYVQAYITLLEKGAELEILPHPTSKLLYEKLKDGPIYVNVCPKPLNGTGRMRTAMPHKDVPDEINGIIGTHSIVVYGNDEDGNFLIADPWNGLYSRPPETLLCSMAAAEIECDAQLFQIFKK